MIRRGAVICLIGFLLVSVCSCNKKAQVQGIELDVTFSADELSDNLITDITYHWKTLGDFVKMEQDMTVYVHFWHQKNLLFADDFTPNPPTSQWDPNQEYTFTRRIYIPTFIDEFDPDFKGSDHLNLNVGFYSPYDRSGESKKEIISRDLKVVPPPLDTPEIIYESGWYDLEINPDSYLKQWRWIGKEARCIIDNPKKDALLVIKGSVNREILKDQKVILKINDLILDEFIPESGIFEKAYNIKKEMLGEADEFYLYISSDKTFVPAEVIPNSTDERILGFQVSFIYFR